ncbi:MAG TPA: hypothetical protein VMP67_10665 [Candidatus Limnocylindria bacterium]|nr:hypothetical protein [Candidatus Limnocylindria bacterium]
MRACLTILLGPLLVACTALAPGDESPSPPPTVHASQPSRPDLGTPPVNTIPPELTPEPVLGEVPAEVLDVIVAEAAELAGVEPVDVEVVRAQQVTWNDGSLGCPAPGTEYTQEPVDGYWVELRVGDEQYDFRMSETGTPMLCPPGQGRPTSPGTVPDY